MLSPKSIANYFLDLAAAAGESITPMKLQKLVYYAHGWYAGYTGRPLIDETVEAWQYGPVIPSLYREFRHFGSGDIKSRATDFGLSGCTEVPIPADADIRAFLSNVWKSYGGYTGIALSEMTHAAGTPWDETWSEAPGLRGMDIPFPRIKQWFGEAAAKAQKAPTN